MANTKKIKIDLRNRCNLLEDWKIMLLVPRSVAFRTTRRAVTFHKAIGIWHFCHSLDALVLIRSRRIVNYEIRPFIEQRKMLELISSWVIFTTSFATFCRHERKENFHDISPSSEQAVKQNHSELFAAIFSRCFDVAQSFGVSEKVTAIKCAAVKSVKAHKNRLTVWKMRQVGVLQVGLNSFPFSVYAAYVVMTVTILQSNCRLIKDFIRSQH